MDILGTVRRLGRRVPRGFRFNRPLVLIQSDDWGRVGVRDQEGREELRAAGIQLGEDPYDLYSLETAEDVHALLDTLQTVRDSAGQAPCVTMNFVVANLDFAAGLAAGSEDLLKPLAKGLPGRWLRPGLMEAYREGITAGVFAPALHGATHFCVKAVKRALNASGDRAALLHTLWKAETPYIHWRMPWVGYEYWDPEQPPAQRFISENEQEQRIRWAADAYRNFFRADPMSACAPGYRADENTHRHWMAQRIRVAQNGPGAVRAPHFDDRGLLHTYRSLDFEPALKPELLAEDCCESAAKWLSCGMPLIISVHSINFHSTLARFRQKTLPLLADFLSALKQKFTDLLFINDRQLLEVIETGAYESGKGKIPVTVTRVGRGQA